MLFIPLVLYKIHIGNKLNGYINEILVIQPKREGTSYTTEEGGVNWNSKKKLFNLEFKTQCRYETNSKQ